MGCPAQGSHRSHLAQTVTKSTTKPALEQHCYYYYFGRVAWKKSRFTHRASAPAKQQQDRSRACCSAAMRLAPVLARAHRLVAARDVGPGERAARHCRAARLLRPASVSTFSFTLRLYNFWYSYHAQSLAMTCCGEKVLVCKSECQLLALCLSKKRATCEQPERTSQMKVCLVDVDSVTQR